MKISELFERCVKIKESGFALPTFSESGNTYFVYTDRMRFTDFILGKKTFVKKTFQGVSMNVFNRIARSGSMDPIGFDSQYPVTMTGFSYGAGRALIAYFSFKLTFPETPVKAILFGCPRVFAFLKKRYRKLFADVSIYNDINDPVASFPPKWLGYTDVGNIYTIGVKGKKSFKAHSVEQYKKSLGIV